MVRIFAFISTLVLTTLVWGAEPIAIPPLSARVTDLSATLSGEQIAALDASLATLERDKGAQVAILMLPSTRPETIEQFGIRLAEAWQVGRRDVDDGVIIIVAKDDRETRIEVGRGLEGAVPDVVAKRIVTDVMAPRFAQGDFAGGMQKAVLALTAAVSGEALPPPRQEHSEGGNSVLLLFLALMAGALLRSLLGLLGAVLAAMVAGWLAWGLFASWLAVVFAAAITLLFSFARGGGRGWSAGGSAASLGSGISGTGGGFSGGGGSFGGGGASGRW